MPAVSKSQQRLFGMADAIKRGELSPDKYPSATKIAKSMSLRDIHDFAATPSKFLPTKTKYKKRT